MTKLILYIYCAAAIYLVFDMTSGGNLRLACEPPVFVLESEQKILINGFYSLVHIIVGQEIDQPTENATSCTQIKIPRRSNQQYKRQKGRKP